MKNYIFPLLFICFNVNAQIKQFRGDYPMTGDYAWVKGEAVYNYEEKEDYVRIKNGLFTFTANMDGSSVGQSSNNRFMQTVKGTYKNNLKDGLWTHSLVSTMVGFALTMTTKAEYSNGVPNGQWAYICTDSKTNKKIGSMSMTFKNNIVGEFSLLDPKAISISGMCDNNGYLHGKISATKGQQELIAEYIHGALKRTINRDLATGEVEKNIVTDSADLEMIAKIQLLQKTAPNELENMPFKLVDEKTSEFESIEELFISVLQPNDFLGDSGYTRTKNSYGWQGFKVVTLKPQETRQQKEEKLRKIEEKRLAEEEKLAEQMARKAKWEQEQLQIQENNKIRYAKAEEEQKMVGRIQGVMEQKTYKEERIDGFYGVSSHKIHKKPIYKAYILLRTYYLDKLETEKDLSTRFIIVTKMDKMYDKVRYWATAESTSDIERQLKGLQDVEAIEKIILE